MNSIMLDVKSLSEYLNICESLIRKLVNNKKIPHNRIGKKILFKRDEIDKWVKDNQIDIEY